MVGAVACYEFSQKHPSKIGNRIARELFAVEYSEMILLHAFIKKTQQTNASDIELAAKRLKEWKNGQDI